MSKIDTKQLSVHHYGNLNLWGSRKNVLQRAGRLIRPQGKITLVMAKCDKVKDRIIDILNAPTGKFQPSLPDKII